MDRVVKIWRSSLCFFGLLAVCANAAVARVPAYSFDPEARRLVLAAPGAIHCATSADGFLTLTSDGSVHSSDPASENYAVVLAGATGASVREIKVSEANAFSIGPFRGERITLTSAHAVELTDALSLTSALSVAAPAITVNGDVSVPGPVDGTGHSRGGDIRVFGKRVTVGASGRIDASGASGGGQVLLGGDYQGGNNVPTAANTRIASGALIRADALVSGDGGRVIVWADEVAAFHGHISARGGEASGNGGFVEVSGKAKLDFTGSVDTDATHGNAGILLLDPANITIQSMAPDINGDTTLGDDFTHAGALDDAATDFPGASSIITDGALEAVLISGNVVLAATNNITFNSVVNLSSIGGNPRTLTLNAGNSVTIAGGGGFSATGASSSLTLFVNADFDNNNAGRYFQQGNIQTNGGSVTIVARDTVTATGAHIQADIATNGGNITVTATGPTTDIRVLSPADLSAGSGNITLTGDRISIEASTSLSGSGQLTLQPLTPSTEVLLGGAGSTTTDFLTTAEIAEINNGFSTIAIGRTDSNGALSVHAAGVSFSDPLVMRSSGATNLAGVLTITDGAGVSFQNGGTTIFSAAGGIDAAGPVVFSDAVTTFGAAAALSGTSVTFHDALAINLASAGLLSIDGDVVLGPAATWNVTANGSAPSQFDQLFVDGAVALGGTLAPVFGFTPLAVDTMVFLDNDATDSVTGIFTNQAPGSVLDVSGTQMLLAHNLGDGNDVGFVATIHRDGFETGPGDNLTQPSVNAAQGQR